MWLKGTPNGSGLLPSPQPLYAIAKFFKWQSTSNQIFKVRKKTKNILEILFLCLMKLYKPGRESIACLTNNNKST